SSKKNKCAFTLLYKASRDGLQNRSFNEKCVNQGPCLVVTKYDEANKIIGGYTSVGFKYCNNNKSYNGYSDYSDYSTYYADPQSFLFSFGFKEIKNPVICRIKNQNNALYRYNHRNSYNSSNNNSNFNFGNELYMNHNGISLSSNRQNYDNLDLLNDNVGNFSASEIEAFRVQFNN